MGTIGVRCSNYRKNLWFHLDFAFARGTLHPSFRTDGGDKELNEMMGQRRHPWNDLTYVGSRVALRTLAIGGVVELLARPQYFDLHVADETRWPIILRAIVEIIRHESDDPGATVIHVPNEATPVPQWHLPLLEELFGYMP